jgi:hypothetical protein
MPRAAFSTCSDTAGLPLAVPRATAMQPIIAATATMPRARASLPGRLSAIWRSNARAITM